MLGFPDFTSGFRGNRPAWSLEGDRVVEIVFRPSLWAWLVNQAGGNQISEVVNDILANAHLVDWDTYHAVEAICGGADCFRREDGPPENAIELCERLLGAWDEVDETDSQARATTVADTPSTTGCGLS